MKGDHIKYWSGYKYQLAESYTCQTSVFPPNDIFTFFFTLLKDGTIKINEGYAWDGASGPTFDTKSSMRGSLIHDVLYQAMDLGLLNKVYKDTADNELRKICIEDGMWKIRANAWYQAVSEFGGCWSEDHPEKVTIAP